MKDELGVKIMRPKTYSCLADGNEQDKNATGSKNCFIKQKLKFQDFI